LCGTIIVLVSLVFLCGTFIVFIIIVNSFTMIYVNLLVPHNL